MLCVCRCFTALSDLSRGSDRYPQTHAVAAAAAPSHACWMISRPRFIASSLLDVRQSGVGFLGFAGGGKVSGVGAWGFLGELGPVSFPCSQIPLFSKHPLEFSFGACGSPTEAPSPLAMSLNCAKCNLGKVKLKTMLASGLFLKLGGRALGFCRASVNLQLPR